jgi:hypothetical protein
MRQLPSLLSVATVVIVVATACGGGSSSSPEADVKQVAADFIEATIDGRNGVACALTTDPGKCLGALALAAGFVGEGGFAALLGNDWRENLDAAVVTFADDDHASVPPLSDKDEGTELIRKDGEWLIVFEE